MLTNGEDQIAVIVAGVTATIFEVIHCSALFQFPSHAEQLLWGIPSLVMVCMPMLLTVVNLTGNYFPIPQRHRTKLPTHREIADQEKYGR